MHPTIKQRDMAAATGDKPVAQAERQTPAAVDKAVSAPLLALLGDDAELRLWLQYTGYFDATRRERFFRSIRKLRAVEEERDKLVLELRAETGGLLSPPAPSPSSLSLSSASLASAVAAAAAAAGSTLPQAPGLAPSYPASITASSVADSARGSFAPCYEQRSASTEEVPSPLPSPLTSARPRSISGKVGGGAHGGADTRFFLVKCFDSANVYMSQRDGLWATQAKNGPIFTEAFEECQSVILFFSINKSRAFQGFARMTSAPDATLDKPDWIRNINLTAITEPFHIEWISTAETDFDSVGDLKNPLNEFRSIVVGRDGQEYSADCGRKMMAILSRHPAAARPAKPAKAENPRSAFANRPRSPRSPYDGARGPSQGRRRQRDTNAPQPPPAPVASDEPFPRMESINLIDC